MKPDHSHRLPSLLFAAVLVIGMIPTVTLPVFAADKISTSKVSLTVHEARLQNTGDTI